MDQTELDSLQKLGESEFAEILCRLELAPGEVRADINLMARWANLYALCESHGRLQELLQYANEIYRRRERRPRSDSYRARSSNRSIKSPSSAKGSSTASEPVGGTVTLVTGNTTSRDLRFWLLLTSVLFCLISGLVAVMAYLFADARNALLHMVLAWVVGITTAAIGTVAALAKYSRSKAETEGHIVEVNRNGVRIRVLGPAALGSVVYVTFMALAFRAPSTVSTSVKSAAPLALQTAAPTTEVAAPALTIAPTPTAEPSTTAHDSQVPTKASTTAAVRPTSGSRPNKSSAADEKPSCQSVGARRPTALAIDPTGADERTYQEPDVWEIVRASCQAKEGRKAKANSWTITRAGLPFECFCRD